MPETLIRTQTSDEWDQIHEVIRDAFGRLDEAQLVMRIRERHDIQRSLVAVQNERVIGHILLTEINLWPAPGHISRRVSGIAPLSVRSDFQGEGVGSMLMQALAADARSMGIDALFLLGDPAYYQRFGFVKSHIQNEYGASDAFQHLELRPGCLTGISATARYCSAFAEAGV